MASNKDLRADITALCAERGAVLPEDLDDLKNDKLVEILEGLKKPIEPVVDTPLRPLVAPSPLDGAPAPEAAPPAVTTPRVTSVAAPSPKPAVEATGAAGYFVAEGKTVIPSTGREALGAFQQVYVSDFQDGIDSLERLRAAGYLFKR